jgi:hypothetical protein
MTNTSPITTTNFIAGTIGVGLALTIMPQIIMGTVGASQQGQVRTQINGLIQDINAACANGENRTGSISLDAGYTVKLRWDDYEVEDPQGETVEQGQVACQVRYAPDVESSWSEYDIDYYQIDGDDRYEITED